jgi:hypothetical protein
MNKQGGCRLAPNETCIEADVPFPILYEINGERIYLYPEQDEKCRACNRSLSLRSLSLKEEYADLLAA